MAKHTIDDLSRTRCGFALYSMRLYRAKTPGSHQTCNNLTDFVLYRKKETTTDTCIKRPTLRDENELTLHNHWSMGIEHADDHREFVREWLEKDPRHRDGHGTVIWSYWVVNEVFGFSAPATAPAFVPGRDSHAVSYSCYTITWTDPHPETWLNNWFGH